MIKYVRFEVFFMHPVYKGVFGLVCTIIAFCKNHNF